MQLTPVVFEFVAPNGEPITNTAVDIQLSKPTFDVEDSGMLIPRPLTVVTDSQGKATLNLVPGPEYYFVSVYDSGSDAGLSYKFIVPALEEGMTQVRLQDIVVVDEDTMPAQVPYDAAALLVIQNSKAIALTHQVAAETAQVAAEAAQAAAEASATAAAADAATVLAQIDTTQGQIDVTAAQVISATDAATLATAKADAAALSATDANSSAVYAESQADAADGFRAAAAASAGAAATSAQGAADQVVIAQQKVVDASGYAGEALASKNAAAASATAAAGSATASGASAAAADGSATLAGTRAADALASKTAAAASAAAALTSATNAQDRKTAAEAAAAAANTSAGTATTQAGLAAGSATSASTAKAGAEAARDAAVIAKTAAETAEAAAEAAAATATAGSNNANTQAAAAADSQINAANSATAAALSANASAASAAAANDDKLAADASAQAAANSATNLAAAVTAADGSADAAAASATTAGAHEAAALTQRNAAENAATSAAGSATTATTQAGIATTKAGEAAANAAQTLAIYGNTAGLNAAQQTMLGYANTATNQANLAAQQAAAAASVSQQDLTGVAAAALHRSPNSIVAPGIYDTSKDSDGGAWVARCGHLSYLNEALNGVWRGQYASEAAVRAVAGVMGGDYYQLTGDGKFYRLNKNRLAYASDFTNAAWVKSNITSVTSKADGVGDGIVESAVNGTHELSQAKLLVGVANTMLVRIKPGARGWAAFTGGGFALWVDLSTGALGTQTNVSNVTVTALTAPNNGYFDIQFTAVPAGGTFSIFPATANNVSAYAGNGGSVGVYIAQAQVATEASADFETKTNPADAEQTEVFRGNKARFPRMAAVVVEASRVVIYDLLEPGRPMWKVLVVGANYPITAAPNGVAMVGGCLLVPTNGSGFSLIDFANDRAYNWTTASGRRRYVGNLAQVNAGLGWAVDDATKTISNNTVLCVSACFLPDAPVDAATGLQGFLIALGCNSGFSLIKPDGTVANSSTSVAGWHVSVTPRLLTGGSSNTSVVYALNPATLGTAFATTTLNGGAAPAYSFGTGFQVSVRVRRELMAGRHGSRLIAMRFNESTPAASLVANIENTYTTGWMPGGTIRAVLCDTVTGVVNAGDLIADRTFKAKPLTAVGGGLARNAVAAAAQLVAYSGFSNTSYLQEAYSADLDPGTAGVLVGITGSIPANVAAAGWAVDRSAAAGSYYRLGHTATGQITGQVYDGTTLRTVTTAGTYNTGTLLTVYMAYETSGSLTLWVNGKPVAQTTGNPLLTLTNAAAVFTGGIDRALTAPWAGSLLLVKIGMTQVGADAHSWIAEQEKEMFRSGAQVTLPDAGTIADLDYDPVLDKWVVVSPTNTSEFVGLVRVASTPVAAGSNTKVAAKSGVKLVARSTTSPGVDVTIPSQNAKEEFLRREEAAASARAKGLEPFDWVGGFTASATNGSAVLTGAAPSIPRGASLQGATFTAAGSFTGTRTVSYYDGGTSVQVDAAATATNTATLVFLDFVLPAGFEAKAVLVDGVLKQEGSTKAWTRRFDGIRETIRFATAPGATAWVQIQARRIA